MSTVEHLSRLWTQPLPAGADDVAAFGELYTDPVRINGADVPLTGAAAGPLLLRRRLPPLAAFPTAKWQEVATRRAGRRPRGLTAPRRRVAAPSGRPPSAAAPPTRRG